MVKKKTKKWMIVLLVVLVIVVCAAVPASKRAAAEEANDSVAAIEETVMARALQCYVIEGAYPVSLEYLEENYGLSINRDDYLVIYTPFAENLPPEVKVMSRAGQGETK